MTDEIKRIIKLVQEGKLSAEDAAELIDAFATSSEPAQETSSSEQTPPPPPPQESPKDPFKSFVETMERLGKEASDTVNWQEVATQIRHGAKKGVDAVRAGLEDVSKGKVRFDFMWPFTSQEREVVLPLALAEGKTLRIENGSGDIRVSGGIDKGSVKATVVARASNAEEARSKVDSFSLILEESDHAVVIKQPFVSGLTVNLDVQIPKATMVEIRGESGDIDLAGTAGSCRIQSRSGDIKLRGLDGLIEIVNASGDVSVSDTSTTSLSIENKSGDIEIKEVKGAVNARTGSGDVTVKGCTSKVLSVESVSGDVSIDLAEPVCGSINVRTVSGNALVGVGDGSSCRVHLSTLRGDVSCDLTLSDETRSDQRITGRLGSGTGSLDVSAVNGDIKLVLRDAVIAE